MSASEEWARSFRPAIIIGSVLLVLILAITFTPKPTWDRVIELIWSGADKAKELKK